MTVISTRLPIRVRVQPHTAVGDLYETMMPYRLWFGIETFYENLEESKIAQV